MGERGTTGGDKIERPLRSDWLSFINHPLALERERESTIDRLMSGEDTEWGE
jgi:hypothetical protein